MRWESGARSNCRPTRRRRWPAGGAGAASIAGALVAAAPFAARGEGPAALGAALGVPAGLGLLGFLGLAAVAAWSFAAELGLRRDLRQVRRRYAAEDYPVFLTDRAGRVEWCNRAARALGPAAALPPDAPVGLRLGADGARIYRLARRAELFGFAAEPHGPEEGALLTVRAQEPHRLLWAVLSAEAAEDPWLVEAAGAPASRFALLRVDADGTVHPSPGFRARFADPRRLLDALGDAAPDGVRRMLIEDRAGACVPCLVATEAGGPSGSIEHLVLPLAEDAAPSAGVTLEALPVALMELDAEGRTLWCNALAREIIGRDVAPGAPLTEVIEPLGRPVGELLAEVAKRGTRRREMVRLRNAESEAFLHISLSAVGPEGARRILAVLTDASELRLLEDKFAQSQKMEAIGKLAGGVAHDFNNVLTAISGHADLLLLGKDARHPDYSDLMQIRQNTHRATALVRQLLAFSRKQTLQPAVLSVEDVVSDTRYLLDRLIGEKVSLVVEHGEGVGRVRADRQQLEQALMNLVVNARDAMPGGGVVTIATARRHLADETAIQGIDVPAGSYVEISVADSGTGIDEAHIGRIFEPFFTTKGQGEGTGLGLSTVYGIVKQSGGYIFAENRPEGGACFRILLPEVAGDAEAPAPAVPDGGRELRRDLTGRGAILLVEDEDPVRAFASRALRLRGYEVIEAASAEEAMHILSDPALRVDLLISDVVMPGMDGPSFAIEARRLHPGLRVIFISGYAEDSFRRSAFTEEFIFLPKPFSLTELTARVKEALETPPEGGACMAQRAAE